MSFCIRKNVLARLLRMAEILFSHIIPMSPPTPLKLSVLFGADGRTDGPTIPTTVPFPVRTSVLESFCHCVVGSMNGGCIVGLDNVSWVVLCSLITFVISFGERNQRKYLQSLK